MTSDLRAMLSDRFQPRPVTAEVRVSRQSLCDFIRRHEDRVFDVSDPRAARVRALLGWDDETMAAFIDSPLLCQSSPHAGMNSFPPMLAFPWILGKAVELAERRYQATAVHLRTQCTHHDFNDTFAKPHAWWHRTQAGDVVKTHLFKRLPIKYHPILSKPFPVLDHGVLHPADRDAVELAELGRNYAYYCVIFRARLERLAGFHVPHRTIEVPIDVLNRFTIRQIGLLPWFNILASAGMGLRQEAADAPMAELTMAQARDLADQADRAEEAASWPERALIAPNLVNFAQFYRLGLSLMLGGRAMAGYVPEMNSAIAAFTTRLESWSCEPPAFMPFTRVPFVELLELDQEAAACQRQWGIASSLSLVVSALGEMVSTRLEPMLDMSYDEIFDATTA